MSCPRSPQLGPYVLGALERGERADVESHLETCASCRAELDRLAGLPGLLSRLSADDVARLEEGGRPPAAPLEKALRSVAAERRRSRRRGRLLAVASAAAVFVAAALGVLAGGEDGRPPVNGAAARSLTATDPRTGATASVRLASRPWGTRTEVRLSGVRPGERCRLVARARDGRSEVAASWRATYAGRAEVPGAVAIPRRQLVALDVVTADGRRLVRVPLPG